jgi:hypothetical protein
MKLTPESPEETSRKRFPTKDFSNSGKSIFGGIESAKES